MSTFWSLWVIILTTVNLILVVWVLFSNRKVAARDDVEPENRTTGHVYDGIEEYDNPLPKWWFQMFVITVIFAVIYLIIYPGMGNWKGIAGWTSKNQLAHQQEQALEQHKASYGVYSQMSVEELADDPTAMKMAQRIFSNNCAVCHGADAGGVLGFPNLTDNDWLYGGTPDKIKETLLYGRQAAMPAWGAILGEKGIVNVAEYVLKISGQEFDEAKANAGEALFNQNCTACHGADGKGLQIVGAPNLTDDIWLYESSPEGIRYTLRNGRNGVMPAQQDKLREDKIHLLTAYVYSLSLEN